MEQVDPKQNAEQTPPRRRVLQGLAAPLVMTVVPGGAFAANSTGLCLARCDSEARGVKKAKPFKSGDDEWMRVQRPLYKLKIRKSGSNKFTELEGKKFFLGFNNSTFWELKSQNGSLTATKTNYVQGAPDVQSSVINGSYTYAIAYVDKQGVPQGFGLENTNAGQIASTSCWSSLKGLSSTGSKFFKL